MTSRTTVLAVVVGLAVFALAALTGAVILIAIDKPVPGEVWALAGTALGGLTGLLASTRSTIGANETEPTALVATVQPTITTRP